MSAAVGYATIAFLLNFVKHFSTYSFVVYRVLLGGTILAFVAAGRLS